MNVNAVIHINQVFYSAGAHVEEPHGNGTWRGLGLRGYLTDMCATPCDRFVLERVHLAVDEGNIDGAIGAVWSTVFINEDEAGEIELRGQLTLPSNLYEEVLLITQARSVNGSDAEIRLDLGFENEFEPGLFSSQVPAWAEQGEEYGLHNVWGVDIRPARKCDQRGGKFADVMRKIKGYDSLETVVELR